jgi:hypothetical protein
MPFESTSHVYIKLHNPGVSPVILKFDRPAARIRAATPTCKSRNDPASTVMPAGPLHRHGAQAPKAHSTGDRRPDHDALR